MTLLVGLLAIPLTLGKTTVGVQHPHCTTLQFKVLKCIFTAYMKVDVYLHYLVL